MLTEATDTLFQLAAGETFSPPTIEEFFPAAILFE
ncbi:MAG: F0F1 ATP synthase subunit A, partial [Pontimonas sp.]|nr:F0F1 ATP synthase subunit A [Pontimonas sp.]